MVLAERKYLNILDDDHLVVVFVEECAAQNPRRVFVVSLGQEVHRLLDAPRSCQQSLAVGVFAQPAQKLAVNLLSADFAQALVDSYRPEYESINHFGVDNFVERRKIDHHSRLQSNRAAHQHFYNVVVPMTEWIVALAVDGLVLLGG